MTVSFLNLLLIGVINLKIGTFAKKFNVANNTIRYYISLGLIVPLKKGSQYTFDKTCLEDMSLIAELKQFHFTLQEIHKLLSFKRITLFSNPEDIAFFIHMLNEKKQMIVQDVQALNHTIDKMDKKIVQLSQLKLAKAVTGVPFQFIPLLYCPTCQGPLRMQDALIQNQHISTASLHCHCGYEAVIKDGIVITTRKASEVPMQYHFYEQDVFERIHPSLISIIEKGSQWIFTKMKQDVQPGMVVIETHVHSFVFLPKYLTSLQPNALYIFCGDTLEMMQKLKDKIDHINPNLSILYLVNSDLHFPLKHGSIDFVIDSLSFNDHSLFHEIFPLEKIKPYLHQKSKIIGNFSYYDANAKSLANMRELYKGSNRFNLCPGYYEEHMKRNEFRITEQEYVGNTMNPGRYVDFHMDEEKLHFIAYTATQ
ncbi:MerR family transcriptional regulator [Brevibacillus ginsengisoli]|uniref:MerR family transcriptional regulator n=1 Tax=Brevibacillus ginsengisoli TaxID=363854 RepID=UPI003CF28FEA